MKGWLLILMLVMAVTALATCIGTSPESNWINYNPQDHRCSPADPLQVWDCNTVGGPSYEWRCNLYDGGCYYCLDNKCNSWTRYQLHRHDCECVAVAKTFYQILSSRPDGCCPDCGTHLQS